MPAASAPNSQVKASRHEAFVEEQLRRAVRRIRTLDVLAGLLGLFILTGAYGLVVIGLDRWLELSPLVRQIALAGCAVSAGYYLASRLLLPLVRSVNPYYAAVQVEQTLGGVKNSVVNWLDLHPQPLPSAIRAAIGARAARDLRRKPLEEVISGKQVLRRGGLALLLLLALVVMFVVLGPAQFLSLFQRAFVSHLYEAAIATRTTLHIVQPEGGDAVVPVGQALSFVVRVGGRVPKPEAADAVTLQFRYSQHEPIYQERRMLPGVTADERVYRLSALEVQNGFFYRIVGGDAVTPEYRVQARSGPVLTGFEVTYRPRPYVRQPEQKSNDPNLHGLRGTEVSLVARTNRVIKEGRLLLEGDKRLLPAERMPHDPQAMRFCLVLDQPGAYRLRFVSVEGEESGDSVPYTIRVDDDQPPVIDITQPEAEEVELPANGILQVQATIRDDYGLADVQLRLRLKNERMPGGLELKAQPYVPAQFRYDDGGCPTEHNYQDVLELDQLRRQDGDRVPVVSGDILEYWLEATDNCDFPKANVGTSRVYRIKITKPVSKEQQHKERQQAQAEQKRHERQVEQQRREENQQRREQASQQPKDAEPTAEQQRQEQQLREQANQLQEQVDRQPGERKPSPGADSKGQAKDGENQPGKMPNSDQQPGEQKPPPESGSEGQGGANKPPTGSQQKPDAGQSKGQGQPQPQGSSGQDGDQAEAKAQPQGAGGAGEQKGNQSASGAKPGDTKPQGTGTAPSARPGTTRSESQPTSQADKGTGRGDGHGKAGLPSQDDRPATGEAKGDVSSPPGQSKGSAANPPTNQPPPGLARKDEATSQGTGSYKPATGGQAQESTAVKGRPSADQRPRTTDPRKDNPTLHDIDQAVQDLRSGDPQKKADAEATLQHASRHAADPKARQAARDALKKAGSDVSADNSPTEPASKDPKNATTGTVGQNSKEHPGSGSRTGNTDRPDGKDEPRQPGRGDKTGEPAAKTGDPQETGSGSNSKNTDPAERPNRPDSAHGTPGSGPGGAPHQGDRRSDQLPTGEAAPVPGSPADLENKKRAAELQLERWEEVKRRLTPEMLKSAGMTEEDLQRFDRAYRAMLQRQITQANEQLAPPLPSGSSSLPNVGRRRIQMGEAATPDVSGAGQTQAPAEFRGAYEEFTRELSKLKGHSTR